MSLPDPARVLRHREPALLLRAIVAFGGDTLACSSRGDGPWGWPAMLEGGAQTAGLLAGLQPGGLSNRAVIAEFRRVVIHVPRHAGPLRFTAALDGHVLHFWRCRLAVHAADGAPLLEGLVTLAPGPAAP